MKNILLHRDFLILVLIVFMLKVGVEMREPTNDTAPMLQSPANTHIVQTKPVAEPAPAVSAEALCEGWKPAQEIAQQNLSENSDDNWEVSGHENEKPLKKEPEPFLVHEVDQNTLKQIECAHRQIDQALTIAQPTSLDAAQLRSLQQKLTQLRTQYQSNSPAIALLGPLGAAAIVIKEDDLDKELLHTIKKVASIIHNLAGDTYFPANSIIKELEANHAALDEISRA